MIIHKLFHVMDTIFVLLQHGMIVFITTIDVGTVEDWNFDASFMKKARTFHRHRIDDVCTCDR